eukprot:TRINITY_DN147_c0_g1_i1.p1 TRINITY_DN147_c0_g1~~TRINITY_DN147_c0_g1_i1.p1  ORF type:complete len:136 (+),score=42.43 TRINITY_DN147_c0_g1_i1:55-462(+)
MSASGLAQVQERVQVEFEEFRTIQKELAKFVSTKQTYLSQLNENEMVKKELGLLESDADVFKLIGPVLVKQDLAEVKSNVDRRLEFIRKEMERTDKSISDLEKKGQEKQKKIAEIQNILIQARNTAAQKAQAVSS